MKKIILSLAVVTLLFACGSSSSDKKEEKPEEKKEAEKTEEPASELSDNPVYQKGLALIAKSDCLTCHKVDEPLTGPTYREVANKYASMPDTIIRHLAGKIISGGNGVWGEVFMTPHAGVSVEDAEAMVKYILLLKK
jgi:cytochrome c